MITLRSFINKVDTYYLLLSVALMVLGGDSFPPGN